MSNTITQALNWFDYTLIGIIVLSTILGLLRGFLKEIISLIAWISGVLLALRFTPALSNNFQTLIQNDRVRYYVTFAVIVILTLIVGAIINAMIKQVRSAGTLHLGDRLFGLIFGAARGVFIVSVVILFIQSTTLKNEPWFKSSQLSPRFEVVVDWLESFLPEKIKQLTDWIDVRMKRT